MVIKLKRTIYDSDWRDNKGESVICSRTLDTLFHIPTNVKVIYVTISKDSLEESHKIARRTHCSIDVSRKMHNIYTRATEHLDKAGISGVFYLKVEYYS